MSGVVACWHRDGRPLGGELQTMMAVAAGRGRDGQATWQQGSIGLGQLHHATSRHDGPRPKLAVDGNAGVAVVVDGHIHERSSLCAALGVREATDPNDADLILLAYRQWGTKLMRRVFGDLAVVVWNGPARQLIAVTDHLAFRNLVWWADHQHVLIASEPAQLLAHRAVEPVINEAVLAEAYADRFHTPDETLLDGVRRVAAGRAITFSADGRVHTEAWSESPFTRSPRRSASAWIDEYRSTLAQVVADALDTSAPPTMTVSGGLDSSSILCTAHHYGTLDPHADIVTYGVSHAAGDPPRYVDAISATTGLGIARLPLTRYDWPRTIDTVRQRFVLPVRGNAALHRILIDRTAAAGRSVIITGEGGDDWLNYQSLFWPDRLARGQFDLVWRGAGAILERGWARAAARAGRSTVTDGLLPLLSRQVGYPAPPMSDVPPWIAPGFARRVALGDRLRHWHGSELRGPYVEGTAFQIFGGIEVEAAGAGVEYRHPFHDRRHIELLFAMPGELTVRHGVKKWVLRQAMEGILPPLVANRPDKGDFTVFVEQNTQEVIDHLGGIDGLGNLVGVQQGYLDRGKVIELGTRSLACAAQDVWTADPLDNIANLWAVLAADIWLSVRLGLPPPVPLPREAADDDRGHTTVG
jgi:asparagine synthase (glutamine-hydrolysing)